ncbi:MAG: hypothetical protein WC256_11610, partial [Desulfurivibrionaceae bacterium]
MKDTAVSYLKESDPDVYNSIRHELARQSNQLELI